MKKITSLTIIILAFCSLSAQPDWVWTSAFGQSEDIGSPSTYIEDMATDSDGNSFIAGYFNGTITGQDFFFYDKDASIKLNGMVVGFNNLGEYLWHSQIISADGTPYLKTWVKGIAVDNNGDVYATGMFCGTVNLSDEISITAAALGTYSAFVIKYNGEE